MMTVPMDSSSAPSSQEIVQRLFKKNIELENGLRKAAQAKIPSNPNVWLQMRENYEVIVLEDYEFSEKHEVEFKLWQLHYRRIEEFRVHINAAKSSASAVAQGAKGPARTDHLKKIRSAFKSFLSEATGFYHDLMHKIRAKYSLPLGYVPESHVLSKDEMKSAEMKKGLISCHRCLIYLGDLARYKGMYGEGDSINHDFTAASSYYLQAASLSPSSGNPHHQLAILASYSSDELVTIYRYFRSLAVDNPFSTARDNLIIAFEKNRQKAAQLTTAKAASANGLPPRSTGRGRGRGRVDGRFPAKNRCVDSSIKDQELSIPEIFNAFSTRFVRLQGILFTRTSLETFEDVLSVVISDLLALLSSGHMEAFNFGTDAAENGLVILRLVSMLIFMVHDLNRSSNGNSSSEILQRSVLLQNVCTALFLFAGHIVKRCGSLHDVAASYLLSGIMVFIEWLACHLDIAVGFDVHEKQASARSFFWHEFISFMNALLLSGHGYIDTNEDELCFSDMSWYDDEEGGNRLALWEDFELRGFLPLVQAHLILDFSRKQSLGGTVTNKEKSARVQRIFAAGKTLMNVIQIEEKGIYFDQLLKRFVCGVEPRSVVGDMADVFTADSNGQKHAHSIENKTHVIGLDRIEAYLEGEDDEEEIVFKPIVSEKYPNVVHSVSMDEALQPSNASHVAQFVTTSREVSPQPWRSLNSSTLELLLEKEVKLSDGLKNMHMGTGLSSYPTTISSSNPPLNHVKAADVIIPSPLDSIMPSEAMNTGLPMSASAALPTMLRKAPVSRPTRHFGPPPGFGQVAPLDDHQEIDDYSWLDDYKPSSTKVKDTSFSPPTVKNPCAENNNLFNSPISFRLPGKQTPSLQSNVIDEQWQEFKLFEQLKPYAEHNIARASLRRAILPEKHHVQSLWPGHFFV
ncbi:hypothetical protein HPP92_023522 [Vanilla planifolia]|uniref:Protein SMG7 n=1 Tax=Vanilla planifolia TaxID=51239 RepID=A0A835PLY0_VANPL|nr:hypothetical protein HPP92_023522 [Vanilla planifolia]